MTGIKPGPPPKPDDVRQRVNARPEQTTLNPSDLPEYVDTDPTPPPPNEKWHPVARSMYDALLSDPCRMNMTSGDWALSMLVIENVHRDMQPQVVATIPGTIEDGIAIPGDVVREPVAINGSRMANVLKWASFIGLGHANRMSMNINIRLGTVAPGSDAPAGVVKSRADLFLVEPPAEQA